MENDGGVGAIRRGARWLVSGGGRIMVKSWAFKGEGIDLTISGGFCRSFH